MFSWSVTKLASTQWCERQSFLQLTSGKRVQTKAMAAGTEIHASLEREIHDVVEIKVSTAEDRQAVHLLNLMQSSDELLSTGVTRETPVWNRLRLPPSEPSASSQSTGIVFGIIDEISLSSSSTGARRLCVRDSKTRSSGRLPSESAQRSGKLQLQVYSYMLEQFIRTCSNHVGYEVQHGPPSNPTEPALCASSPSLQWLMGAWQRKGMDLHAPLSQEVCASLAARGIIHEAHQLSVAWRPCEAPAGATAAAPPAAGAGAVAGAGGAAQHITITQGERTATHASDAAAAAAAVTGGSVLDDCVPFVSLRGLLELTAQAVSQLPTSVDDVLELVYRRQQPKAGNNTPIGGSGGAGDVIGVVRFARNTPRMQACVRRALLVYSGTAEARPVPEAEWHKCKYCAFVHECGDKSPMVAKLGAPPPDWVPEGHAGAVIVHRKRKTEAKQEAEQACDSDGDVEWSHAALAAVMGVEASSQHRPAVG